MGFIGQETVAGKTTTHKSILNLVHPDAGSVCCSWNGLSDNGVNIKQQIGYAVGGINYYTRKS